MKASGNDLYSNRPKSAGHHRSSGGYANHNTTYARPDVWHERPSSSTGIHRPTASSEEKKRAIWNPNTSGDRGTNNTTTPGYARPKSAGADRSKVARKITEPRETSPPVVLNISSAATSRQRPASASGTRADRPVPNPVLSYRPDDDRWNTSYRLHYGLSAAVNANGTVESEKQRLAQKSSDGNDSTSHSHSHHSKSASSRIRAAIDLGHQYAQVINKPSDGDMIDEKETGLDSQLGTHVTRQTDDDDGMDGKRIESSSHPEVSTCTPSASLELGDNSTNVDLRNASSIMESLELRDFKLSTIPNQFCSAKEAMDLQKLIVSPRTGHVRAISADNSAALMDMYMVGKIVGVGSYGKVRAAWHRLTGNKIAIKTYDKAKLKDPEHWKRVTSEIKILEIISHPRISRMYEAVETPKRLHLIMECVDGGNLCTYVKSKRRLSEDESRKIFFQLVQAVEYLHSQNIIHRDIKLENVLFTDSKDIKLIDFGFSTIAQNGKKLRVFCGTPSYMAPEIVRRMEYEGKPVDMWSLGILLYALLCGCFPFRARSYPDLYRRIARGTFTIPDELSTPVRDLLRQLLSIDAYQRISAQSVLRHPWLHTQLATAPDMSKLRAETTILISDKAADDLDEEVVTELVNFGISKEDIVKQIMSKKHSSLATLYYLMLDTTVNNRKAKGVQSKHVVSSGTDVTRKYSRADSAPASAASSGGCIHVTAPEVKPDPVLNLQSGNIYIQRPRSASAGRPHAAPHARPRSASATRRHY